MNEETEFLALVVGRQVVKIGQDRKRLIEEWPIPKSLTDLRSFLVLVQFFRCFFRYFSRLAAPLTNLTRKHRSISQWNDQCDAAFNALKEALGTAPIMGAHDWSRTFRCHKDAC